MASSQDHKARDDGDAGPNTGGMGAYSPAPVVSSAMEQCILEQVIHPTLDGLRKDGIPYSGFLYAGLMITPEGIPKVIEFNCRMGDPETQPIMARLRSDLVDLCLATLDGSLDEQQAEWDTRASLGVVMAAGGYPGQYSKGDVISGLPKTDDSNCKVFHAGTIIRGDQVLTSGGRVLCVVGLGESVVEAQRTAYQTVSNIRWADAYFRKDIGYRAVRRARG
jgi:phosphoribosylamine--glycine ligase